MNITIMTCSKLFFTSPNKLVSNSADLKTLIPKGKCWVHTCWWLDMS